MTTAAVAQLDMGTIMGAITRKEPKHYVDFARVPISQWKIHDRLENWRLWSRGSSRQSGAVCSPIFGLASTSNAKSIDRIYGELTSVPVDRDNAIAVNEGIGRLPDKHRRALQWCYLHPRNPTGQARELGVDLEGLARLVDAARFKLIDMGL